MKNDSFLAKLKAKNQEKKRINAEKASWTAGKPISTDLMEFSTELTDWLPGEDKKND